MGSPSGRRGKEAFVSCSSILPGKNCPLKSGSPERKGARKDPNKVADIGELREGCARTNPGRSAAEGRARRQRGNI